jgi:ADP-ribosylation factor-binding protein GGA
VPPMAPVPLTSQAAYNGTGHQGLSLGGAPGVTRSTISPPQVSGTPPAIMLPGTPIQKASPPNYFGTHANLTKGPTPVVSGMGRGLATSSSLAQTSQRPQPAAGITNANSQVQGKDPFADLAGLF